MTGPSRGRVPAAVIWTIGLVAAVATVIVVVLTTRFGTDPNLVASPLVGSPAPDLALPDLDGDGSLPLHEPGTVGVVNFWASWCLPCRAEHGVLLGAAEQWGELGVRVVGVLYQDDPDAGRAFLDELGRGYPAVTDDGSAAAIEFGVFGVPETYVIDRDGTIAAVIRGQVTEPLLDRTIEAVVLGQEVEQAPPGTVQARP